MPPTRPVARNVIPGELMLSPYGRDIVESCLTRKMRAERLFCDLPTSALQSFESVKYATAYAKGAVLFVGGKPRAASSFFARDA